MAQQQVSNVIDVESESAELPEKLCVIAAQTADMFKSSIGGTSFYEANLGKKWDLSKQTAKEFINIIERKFARNNKLHGYFSSESPHMAPVILGKYIRQELKFEQVVKEFVDNALLVANEPGRGSLMLGHLVFVHYKDGTEPDDIGRFLAVLVGKQAGFDFNSDLEPVNLTSINTSELRHAAMFDLTLFDIIYPGNDGDSYVKFIAGKSRSDFLRDAFGCGDYIPNKNSVEELNRALQDFLGNSSLKKGLRQAIIESVKDHLAHAASKQLPVTLDEVQQVINKKLPNNAEETDRFKEFVNNGGYTVSAVFQPTRSSAEKIHNVEINDPTGNFKCTVTLGAIGYMSAAEQKPVKVDDNLEYITLPLTTEAREAIRKMLGNSDEPKS